MSEKLSFRRYIGLFFGSFNPIHLGHIQLADFIFKSTQLDELWYVVSPRNPLKEQKGLIDEFRRKEMIELAIADKDYLKVSDIEFEMPKPSYTIHTLHALTSNYPDYQFVLLIGSDNMHVFDKWKDYKTIIRKYPIIVYPRKNFDTIPFVKIYPTMQILNNAPFFEISSTEIRDKIKKGKDVSQWLHPAVNQFIKDNNLYSE